MTVDRTCAAKGCNNLRVYSLYCNRCYLAEKRRIKDDKRGRPRAALNPSVPQGTDGAMYCRKCDNWFIGEHMSGKKKLYCKNCIRDWSYNVRTTAKNRSDHLLRRYGLTQEELSLWLERVNNACQICFRPLEEKKIAIDHCHVTKSVRGILCTRCNSGLGHFDDQPESLARAISYLTANGRARAVQGALL